MKKIVFTGPESTGKTTLAEQLAEHFHLPFVREVARDYITQLNRPYQYEDILNIALLQMAEEEKIKCLEPPLLICDTDLLTVQIWCSDKFSRCEPWILGSLFDRLPDMYFLCQPDFSWQQDPLREDPQRQHAIYGLYKSFFLHHKTRFIELGGSIEKRLKTVLDYLNENQRKL